MFDINQIENWTAQFDISNEEAERICAVVETEEEFVKVWENSDWWTDANNE